MRRTRRGPPILGAGGDEGEQVLVIHGLWLPGGSSTGGLAVWAEDSAAPIPR